MKLQHRAAFKRKEGKALAADDVKPDCLPGSLGGRVNCLCPGLDGGVTMGEAEQGGVKSPIRVSWKGRGGTLSLSLLHTHTHTPIVLAFPLLQIEA